MANEQGWLVENVFGWLKGRWRCLLKRLNMKLANIPNVVGSCVVLHELCKQFGDACLHEWLEFEQDNTSSHHIHYFTIPIPIYLPILKYKLGMLLYLIFIR